MEQLLLFVAIVGSLLALSYWQSNRGKERIIEYLLGKGAADIVVSLNWLSGDRDNYVYSVEYTDRQGVHRATRCKVGGGLFGLGEMYWREPPEV
jgi:hypothetical protein